ncbi:MAG: endonuclease/exonuclease/phosphatase family protein [Microbacteriaceae bacterium]|nr:endonuclease/exonuclease/phosphatase family protein [Microbacteriaceae bacterium]
MVFRVISYNLLHSRALEELVGIVANDPDLDALALQEVHAHALPERIGHLRLAEHTRRNQLAIAIYYRHERLELLGTRTFALKRAVHDMMFEQRSPERLVGVHLRAYASGRELILGSIHAAPLTSRNALRRKQIADAHELLSTLSETAPVLMVGDFNYPMFHNRLGERLNRSGYDLVLSDKRTYQSLKLIRGHFDFVTGRGIEILGVETLRKGRSDHYPILVTAQAVDPAADLARPLSERSLPTGPLSERSESKGHRRPSSRLRRDR